ncbi:MBL fold metallo-hydrolase [Gracilibacillus sp. D59]|uniref:MBL fold metallo-hydrolase n=1 Tax=Gracilibacillus sp. D59 TaxID=3457434 RepID=UPI003FCE08AA
MIYIDHFIEKQHKLNVQKGQIGLSWTGQAGFALLDDDHVVYHIDPYLSNACSRTVGFNRIIGPPVQANQMKTDYVFITHDHKDHLDPDSIPEIFKANPEVTFVGPPSCIEILKEMKIPTRNLSVIRRGEKQEIGNLIVQAVLAIHTKDSVGYVLDLKGLKLYITGDTTYSDDLILSEKLDLMMVCINGRLGCMNIPDAARLTAHIQPKYVIPMHIGMFKENTANPTEFVHQAENYSGMVQGFIMEHGSWYIYDKAGGLNIKK